MEELSSFTNNQMILCICPKCSSVSRFSDLRIISTKKTPETWLDGFEKKLTDFQVKQTDFSSKEAAIRKQAAEKARKQLPILIKK